MVIQFFFFFLMLPISIFKDNSVENVDQFFKRKKKKKRYWTKCTVRHCCEVFRSTNPCIFFLSPGLLYGPYTIIQNEITWPCAGLTACLPPYDNYRVRTLSKVY